MQKLLIIRHAESEKNLHGQFDGDPKTDRLTAKGRELSATIGQKMSSVLDKQSVAIYSASSGRAMQTGEEIFGDRFTSAEIVPEFGSMRSGAFAGMNDDEIRQNFPEFFQDLQKFRLGLISGYEIRVPKGADEWVSFEKKVTERLFRIETDAASFKVIVCHRSTMMALLVNLGRRFTGYPKSHFGFMNVEPLCSVMVHYDNEEMPMEIDACKLLLDRLIS